jgi:hypothetical protein
MNYYSVRDLNINAKCLNKILLCFGGPLVSNDRKDRAKDIPMVDIPGYMEWANRMLDEGKSTVLITHLDSTSMCLLPEEIVEITENDFNEMLIDLENEFEN